MIGTTLALTGMIATVVGVALATLGPHASRATALVFTGLALQTIAQYT